MGQNQMLQLPLFPLRTVLFPNMPINLHIFENRYQEMIRLCIDEKKPFGVVLIKKGKEANGPLADPYPTGCTAQIVQMERLSEGRMNITAVGKERFTIHELDRTSKSYLLGNVTIAALSVIDVPSLTAKSLELKEWVRRYLELLSQATSNAMDVRYLPNDPVSLIYISAAILQIPVEDKQPLLEVDDAHQLLQDTRKIYQRETALLNSLLREPNKTQGSFGIN